MAKTDVIRDLIQYNTSVYDRDHFTVRPTDSRLVTLPRTHGTRLFTHSQPPATSTLHTAPVF